MYNVVCDQCRTHEATVIDFNAETWCPRCYTRLVREKTQEGELTPMMLTLTFVRMLLDRNVWEDPNVWAPIDDVYERWKIRLGKDR